MRRTLLLLFFIPGLLNAQHLTFQEWQWNAAMDMRLVPRYVDRTKTLEMQANDSAFVAQTLAVIPDRQQASDHLVDLGFGHLREGDLTKAMYRFNQAFLIVPDNPRIFSGYGAFFMALDRPNEAGRQYADGLALHKDNTSLMLDLTAAILAEHHLLKDKDPEQADKLLQSAIDLLDHVLTLDPKSAAAHFKLAVCWLNKDDCTKARAHRVQCAALDGSMLTEEFERYLKSKCPR